MIVAFPVAALRAIAVFAARKDVRNYLNGVCLVVSPNETRIVATNGHCMGLYRSQNMNSGVTTSFDLIIPIDAVLKCKPTRRDPVARVTPNDDGTYMLETSGTFQRFTGISGKFPDLARVVPNTCSLKAGSFDPHVISMFGDAAIALGIESTRGLAKRADIQRAGFNCRRTQFRRRDDACAAGQHPRTLRTHDFTSGLGLSHAPRHPRVRAAHPAAPPARSPVRHPCRDPRHHRRAAALQGLT